MKKSLKRLSLAAMVGVLAVGLAFTAVACGTTNVAVKKADITIRQWVTGNGDTGTVVATNKITEKKGVITAEFTGTAGHVIVDLKDFMADKTFTKVTRDDLGAKATTINVYEMVAANTYHGTETWKLKGSNDAGKTESELETAKAGSTNGAIFIYPDEAFVYFGERTTAGKLTASGDVKGDYKMVFKTSKKTYTLKLKVA